ncbi:hypothetical protein P691DRAFT_791888 [Macrolepiota fuliginosa MF-IS2]|uniref:Uncharacterized protein n=1 Tax=Macrolepiota fuliginosa MF-IS2 TaxID=1400762 RepID=A0A9P5X094_9AGAR|nr:hypothetical protein P691DRAFT_791888 [Macrolepiota fuliginosa MF-IS2]
MNRGPQAGLHRPRPASFPYEIFLGPRANMSSWASTVFAAPREIFPMSDEFVIIATFSVPLESIARAHSIAKWELQSRVLVQTEVSLCPAKPATGFRLLKGNCLVKQDRWALHLAGKYMIRHHTSPLSPIIGPEVPATYGFLINQKYRHLPLRELRSECRINSDPRTGDHPTRYPPILRIITPRLYMLPFSGRPESERHFLPLHTPQVRKFDFVGRGLVFIILEFSFLGLSYRCLGQPIPIYPPAFLSPTEVKAAATAIAIVWHTFAIFVVKDVVLFVLSAECMAQYRRTGDLMPDTTDRVSRITSGLLQQASYFLTTRPTFEYRLAFILTLLATILGPLGPSVISPAQSWAVRRQEIRLANLTMNQDILFPPQDECSMRAGRVAQVEMLVKSVFGYQPSTDGILIPWPELDSEATQNVYTFESDVVVYNYSCQWTNFSMSWSQSLSMGIEIPGVANDSMWSLIPPTTGGSTQSNTTRTLSPFMFIGESGKMDFKGINYSTAPRQLGAGTVAAVLLCDPLFTIEKAQVTLSNGTLDATIIPNSSLVGNFPRGAANALFFQGLLHALAPDEVRVPTYGELASLVFLRDGVNPGTNVHPLPLSDINRNMSLALQSAAKVYLSGYRIRMVGEDLDIVRDSVMFNSTATVEYQRDSLVSSEPFFIALVILDILMAIILTILVCSVRTADLQLFTLQTLEGIYYKESPPEYKI